MKRTIIAGAVSLLVMVMVVAGCESGESKAQTFDIKSSVGNNADKSYASGLCVYYDEQLRPGDPVIVKGADGTILGKSELVLLTAGEGPACSFNFQVKGVKAGEPAYEVKIGEYGPVTVTEAELETGGSFTPRNSIQAVWDYPPIKYNARKK
ncbi:hypothetical protein [Gordonia jacobaea]|uniref:hypothetical protein n=1 Tax=Gordonia jacobaea TaxID=122202 RepID=UPI003D7306CF